MSAEAASTIEILSCASCGIAGAVDMKLKDCSACKLVKYCGVECQRKHRPKHKKECKKRAAELRDEILFKQPESRHNGDCPICCLPLPLGVSVTTMMTCCGKVVCGGCYYANQQRATELLKSRCPFCRQPEPDSEEEQLQYIKKRIEANDSYAMKEMGLFCLHDREDHKSAIEYLSKAAGLGDASAHYQLAIMYNNGNFVEKDEKKHLYHLEEAAIGGHANARYNLGIVEGEKKRYDRAIRHHIIAANLGHDNSLELLKKNYVNGYVTKEEFASALRAHKAAVDATKSSQREEGEAYLRMRREERKHGCF